MRKATDSVRALGACTCGDGMVPVYSTLDDAKKGETPSGVVATGETYNQGKTKSGGGFLSSFRSVVFSAEAEQVSPQHVKAPFCRSDRLFFKVAEEEAEDAKTPKNSTEAEPSEEAKEEDDPEKKSEPHSRNGNDEPGIHQLCKLILSPRRQFFLKKLQ